MKLVIVESPAKASTISKFLGKDYKVLASFGHVRDLPKSASEIPAALKSQPWARLGVNVDGDFSAIYIIQKESRSQIAELKKYCKEAEEIILATDEDREGESISWHLLEILKPKVPVKRIVFHEITQSAIEEAMQNPRTINEQLVRAQETRRILDRLFGYELSPVLWRKVRTKLSAGRVQSAALRLVVEREEERCAFIRTLYWDAEAELTRAGKTFKATLISLNDRRIATGKDFDSTTGTLKDSSENGPIHLNEQEAQALVAELRDALPWEVISVEEKESLLRPNPPFITSTLQQAASSQLGFSPRKTMQIAQKLYEGVDLGEGVREGIITYMRTDSVTLSEKALQDAGAFIQNTFGKAYHTRRQYTTKSKLAQEAHEAIRPTHIAYIPQQVAPFLTKDELRLYQIIWERTIASQMADATVMRTTADILAKTSSHSAVMRANGSVVAFPGFLKVMNDRQKEAELPSLKEGMRVTHSPETDIQLKEFKPVGHETQPPSRYTEASLVRRLEEEGIGRPSTYAPTVAIIQQRGYVERVGTALAPTYLGIAVIFLLRQHFSDYVDIGFTARMEDVLDDIAEGRQEWLAFLRQFYYGENNNSKNGLKPSIEEKIDSIEFPVIPIGSDPEGNPIVIRQGKSSPFLQWTRNGEPITATIPTNVYYDELTVEKALDILTNKSQNQEGLGKDPITGKTVFLLEGRYGPYVQLGAETEEGRPKRVRLPKGILPTEITLDKALYLLSLPKTLGLHPKTGDPVAVGVGPYGPYIKHVSNFRSLTTDRLFSITFKEALHILEQPKKGRGPKTLIKVLREEMNGQPRIELYEGRYGPYVTDGETNASLPKTMSPDDVTLDIALDLINQAAEKKSIQRVRRRKSTSSTSPKPE